MSAIAPRPDSDRSDGRARPRDAPSALSHHLQAHLRQATDENEVRRLGLAIIEHLDEDGYLRSPLHDIARECDTSPAAAERALALVQRLDPPGIAARSVRECLLLQLRAAPRPDPIATALVEHHFEALAGRRHARLSRTLGASPARLLTSIGHIASLDVAPGRRFVHGDPGHVVPEVLVHREGDSYRVSLRTDRLPRLRLHALCRALVRESRGEISSADLPPRLRPFRDVHQRQRTLRRVAESIVRFQRAFLDSGPLHLRPLALRDVALDVGIHESTVSRATAHTLAHTPRGIYPLRFFFQSGIAADAGDRVASTSVKALIRERVATEDPAKPLSDLEIAGHLRARGLTIARRTVAKYRVELRIPPSPQRHRLALRPPPTSTA